MIFIVRVKIFDSMKRYSIIILTGLLLTAVACKKNMFWEQPNNVRVVAHTEALGANSIVWSMSDSLSVFDQDGNMVSFCLEEGGNTSGIFYSYEWTGNTPVYASYPAIEVTPSSVKEGEIVTSLVSEQTVSSPEVVPAFAAVGQVNGKNNIYKVLPLKNIMGLFKITVDRADVSSIEIAANAESESTAGVVTVDYTKLTAGEGSFWTPVDGKMKKSVVLSPDTVDGSAQAFKKDKDYYISVLPQTYSKGITIRFTHSDGTSTQRELAAPITVRRNSIFDLDDLLPDNITISLDFENSKNVNPLGTFVSWGSLSVEPATYSYPYEYECNGVSMTENVDFTIICGKEVDGVNVLNRYSYEAKVSGHTKLLYVAGVTGKDGAWCIKLPAFSGRYLKEVSFTHTGTTYNRNFRLQEGYPTAGHYFTKGAAPTSSTATATATITIPTGATNTAQLNETKQGREYYVQLTGKGQAYYITNITVKYTREKPIATIKD